MKTLCCFFILVSFLYGCAPSGSSSLDADTSGPKLPERPVTTAQSVLRRDLLFKDDSRISYCEMLEGQNSSYSGMRDASLQPLASLSKVITSAWALDVLGADYRFKSEIYMNPVTGMPGVFDIYLRTNNDPVVNIEKLLFFISELGQAGVRQIRNLTIDETTRVFLGVLSNPHIELAQVPVSTNETIENFGLIFNSKNWGEKTKQARQNVLAWAQKNKKTVSLPESFSVTSISYKTSNQIDTGSYPIKKVISSAPLFRYLKNLNVYSNNYLADALFSKLGGPTAFQVFQKKSLQLSSQDLLIYTGSGLAESFDGGRQDNLGTCFAMIKVLAFLKIKAQNAQLNLGALLLNPSTDADGTYDAPGDYHNAVVLKTGRLYDVAALNVAGFVSTDKGFMSFVFLGHDFSSTEADQIEASRSGMLLDIYSKFSTQPRFNTIDYAAIFF